MTRNQHWFERENDTTRTDLSPLREPPAPSTSPRPRPASEVLAAVKANLTMARDLTALKLAALKPGSSSWKTTGGFLRGLNEALGVLESECESMGRQDDRQ